jgi:hypothetical protein
MMCPPSIMWVRIRNRRRRFGLWLPLFLIWPVVLVLGLVLLPLLLICAAVLWPTGWGRPLLLGGPVIFSLLCALRGLKVEVNQPSEQVLISFQ